MRITSPGTRRLPAVRSVLSRVTWRQASAFTQKRCMCTQKDKCACVWKKCDRKSQSAATSSKYPPYAAAVAHFKTLMKFFSLMFASPSAWLVKLQNALSSSPPFPPRYLRFIFPFSLFLLPCRYVFCLKAGARSQAIQRVWMCSDTSSSQSLISQGEMGVWHVYISFPFLCRIKNPPPPPPPTFVFPPR